MAPPRQQQMLLQLALRPRAMAAASLNSRRAVAAAALQSQRAAVAARGRSYATNDQPKSSDLHPNPEVRPNTDPQAQSQAKQAELSESGRMKQTTDARVDAAPHVSEEAAAMAESMGGQAPEMEQGTPLGEAVKGDKEFQKDLPKVMQDALKPKRKFSTLARRMQADVQQTSSAGVGDQVLTLSQLESPQHHEINDATAQAIAEGTLPDPIAARLQAELRAQPGLKFDAPTLPMPKGSNMRKDRYNDVVEQVTNLMMRHGKKAQAQRHMAQVLTHLRTAPAPRPNATRPLLPTSPQHYQLPLDPIAYLTTAIDSVAPLMRITSLAGAAGGGASLPIPKPLQLRQRRRTAIKWMLEATERRKGGLSDFPKRFAEEVVSVVEGKSSAWEKRAGVHRLGIAARSNLTVKSSRRR